MIYNFEGNDICKYIPKSRVTNHMIQEIIDGELWHTFILLPKEILSQEICNEAFEEGFHGAYIRMNYKFIPDKIKSREMSRDLIRQMDSADEYLFKYIPKKHRNLLR